MEAIDIMATLMLHLTELELSSSSFALMIPSGYVVNYFILFRVKLLGSLYKDFLYAGTRNTAGVYMHKPFLIKGGQNDLG